MTPLNHDRLTTLAARWLKRPHSQSGPGCKMAVTEPRSGHSGESPDAIGWRSAGFLDGSFLVEVKVSRSDFLADRHKRHRRGLPASTLAGGADDAHKGGRHAPLGNVRFYMCPAGVITVDDLPPQWGLLWVNGRGHIQSVVNPFATRNHNERRAAIAAAWQSSNPTREIFILVGMLTRMASPEKVDQQIRDARRDRERIARRLDRCEQAARTQKLRKVRDQAIINQLAAHDSALYERIVADVDNPAPPRPHARRNTTEEL